MKLSRLAQRVAGASLTGNATTEISSLAYDSRQVAPGGLFFALPGTRTDGSRYIDEAVRKGAVAVVHEPGLRLPPGIAGISAPCARTAMADIAATFYGHPSDALDVIGITGTNGKTTTAFMVRDILQAANQTCGIIGTIRYEIGSRHIVARRTTPESLDLQRMLAAARQADCRALAMEVSSQGLAAERLRGTRFAATVFTNLSEDHLDFHQTMEAYFATKQRLFTDEFARTETSRAIINTDDPYGQRLAADPALQERLITLGTHPSADVRAEDIQLSETASSFQAITPWGSAHLTLNVTGRFNVMNALAAIAVGGSRGIPLPAMVSALANMEPVPGRLERIPDAKGRHIFVDYAHTEDALRNVLTALRETAPGQLICVFGCGGNRDAHKRPLMGAAASAIAHRVIVTSDNPRNEDPDAIIAQIVAGMDVTKPHRVEPDRTRAIHAALREAAPGDTILIAGKGHEPYQEVAGRLIHFDDREVVRAALSSGI